MFSLIKIGVVLLALSAGVSSAIQAGIVSEQQVGHALRGAGHAVQGVSSEVGGMLGNGMRQIINSMGEEDE